MLPCLPASLQVGGLLVLSHTTQLTMEDSVFVQKKQPFLNSIPRFPFCLVKTSET